MFSKSREQSLESFVQLSGHSNIKNCFLMPTEEYVLNKGMVTMKMFRDLEFSDIEVRYIPVTIAFCYYLSDSIMNISELNL